MLSDYPRACSECGGRTRGVQAKVCGAACRQVRVGRVARENDQRGVGHSRLSPPEPRRAAPPLPKALEAAMNREDWHGVARSIDWGHVQGSELRCRGGCGRPVARFHVRHQRAAAPLCWRCLEYGNGRLVLAADLFADPAAELRRLHEDGGLRAVRVLLRGLPGVIA
ncbi:MAG: hypothetical protein JWM31_1197 [Solirubrobacterales bacterium]|nr:hypothetical protein [Solirubrobacterales bacterium]